MALFDTEYEDLNQQPKRSGLSSMSRASDASIPGQPSVPGVSRTVSRENMGPNWLHQAPGAQPPSYITAAQNYGNEGRTSFNTDTVEPMNRNPGSTISSGAFDYSSGSGPRPGPAPTTDQNYGNEGRGISAMQYNNVVSQALSGAGDGGSTFADRMAARQAQRDAAYGSSPAGRDAEAQRVAGIYAREAAIRGLDKEPGLLDQLNANKRSGGIIGDSRGADRASFDRFSMNTDLARMMHGLETKNTNRSLATAGQLGKLLEDSMSQPEEMALKRTALTQQGDIARRGQDAGLLEADARNKTGLQLGRMKDSTDRRGQDIGLGLGMQRDATDRRGQDITERGQNLTYGASLAKMGQERYNNMLKGIDDYFVTTDDKGKTVPDLAAKAAFLRQAGSDGGLAAAAQLPAAQQGPAMAKLLAQHDLQAARTTADPAAPATNQPLRIERGSDKIGLGDALSSQNPGLHFRDWVHSLNPFSRDPDGYAYVATPRDPVTGTQASSTAVPIAGLSADQRQVAEWLNRRDK